MTARRAALLIPLAVLTLALLAGVWFFQAQSATRAGFPAPDFTLRDLAGTTHRLSDLRGRVVFLNVWATWCPPCREEMPAMQRLYERLRSQDFVMLAVSEDEGGPAVVAKFVQEMGLTFPVLLDPEGIVPRLYGLTGFPETFVIDRNGMVVRHVIGPEDWDSDAVYEFFLGLLRPPSRGGSEAGGSDPSAR